MTLFDVYPLYNITPVKAQGCSLWDEQGQEYLDLYGGHAVISIGHQHPLFVAALQAQLTQLCFYSNAVQNPLQKQLAKRLGEVSGLADYQLFLCNSGAEANENALKLASFYTQKKRVIAFQKAFHGRTSAAVAATDNPAIVAPLNSGHEVSFLPLNDLEALEQALKSKDVCTVIIEGIQGVGGIHCPEETFLQGAATLCKQYEALLILDEVQSGYGRSGQFFAFQQAGIRPDIVSIAKGMGNGFPVGGILVAGEHPAKHGILGSTFGGNHLACAAALAVLEVIEEEKLMDNARHIGQFLADELATMPLVKEVRGRGLMLGIELEVPVATLRKHLLMEHKIFTGYAGTHTLRLLPPLSLSLSEAIHFLKCYREATALCMAEMS